MRASSKVVNDEITHLITNWTTLAKDASLGGSTLADFQALVQPSFDARSKIAELESELKEQLQEREAADDKSHAEYLRIVNAIRSDKKFGSNSGLYKALGYIPDESRASGLHRKGAPAPSPQS